jgi:hypothetical protein
MPELLKQTGMRAGADLGQRLRRFMGLVGTAELEYSNQVTPVILLGDATEPGNSNQMGRRWVAGFELAATPTRVYVYSPIQAAGTGVVGSQSNRDESSGAWIESVTIAAAAAANTAALAPEVRLTQGFLLSFSNAGVCAWRDRPASPTTPNVIEGGGALQAVNCAWDGATLAASGAAILIAKPYLAAGATITLPLDVFLNIPAAGGTQPFLCVSNFSAGTLSVWFNGRTKTA